ncbi:hypothetical protein P171DRAFT_432747 [Karstenula rhodostoma CBS 690.94]|uniref:SWIM-type domain-containing protein n=1 Tax=Karstenula rhodostoma CBS 690.94 TaxID=1392251 RepID=A0A9P4PHM6_9PLEO|nr:hypothetical protein P171DRAFT_432747 [Karstenula rhodostoma CBS 690.94]
MASSQLQSTRMFVTQLVDALGVSASASASSERGAADPEARNGNRNTLEGAGGGVKKQMLALHVAFPNELLPALDLLDRSLVTRFRIRRDVEDHSEGAAPQGVRGRISEAHAEGTPGNKNTGGGIIDAPTPDAEMLDAPHSASSDDGAQTTPQDSEHDMMMDSVYYVRSAQQRSSRFSSSFDALTSYEVRLSAWNCSCPAFAFSAFPPVPVHPEPPVPTYEPDGGIHAEEGAWNFGGVGLGEGIPPVCKHLLACVLAERCAGLFGGCMEERVVSVEEAAGWAAGWGD